ncbi:UDP-N-acetylmuramoyl-tripeptide--D-alanyl-D-alanine ligase [Synechococcus sp. RSCCF101]|uniref:UDP-N-acetylmuramoyl-tripeptide--D-alanyl-D- alanine ligase n=1 Tax=Synechococcus sp. RSCCF101 TaxID=2511069 RepID=UPI001248A009|nr:UDP-N-acetylmuramoyl-tripeptide--D-alanyl-D-alanine ligase [Synechococcus sp. RSCCF101]
MALSSDDLRRLWGEPLGEGAPPPGTRLGPLVTDSRQLQAGDVFVALEGERFDGHAFLEQARERGAQLALISRTQQRRLPPGLPGWAVDDTLAGYQTLALLHRRSLAAPVVAVTGSAGKTTTRELIRTLLSALGPVVASVGNENNDIGVPRTLLRAGEAEAALVVEMGMRGLHEIERLSNCSEPDVAVITNIGTAHIGRLGSREAIATAKCEITAALRPAGLVVIPAGDPLLEEALGRVWNGRVRRVALEGDEHRGGPAADCIAALGRNEQGPSLELEGVSLPLPLDGRHNARNLLLAVAVARELGLPDSRLDLSRLDLPDGRSQRRVQGGLTLLDQTYNASPEAVIASLEQLASEPGRRFAVLGTMLELGDRSVELHRRVAARAAELRLDGLLVLDGGPEGDAMLEAAAPLARLQRAPELEGAAAVLTDWLQPGDTVLLKASRGVALERLIPLLPSWDPASPPC